MPFWKNGVQARTGRENGKRRPCVRIRLGAGLKFLRLKIFPLLFCAAAANPSRPQPAEASAAAFASSRPGLWISPQELAGLPTTGPAWQNLYTAACAPTAAPDLSNQDDEVNVKVLAKALVYARTSEARFRGEVIAALRALVASGSENRGRTLALGRELLAYVIAADLIALQECEPRLDQEFRNKLRVLRARRLAGRTLVSTHETRPNNWGTHAGASRIAIAAYLNDQAELQRCALVFKGWLGDRAAFAGFKFGNLSWQADAGKPLGINPKGARKDGHSIDGVLPDDQRRAGPFTWPPAKENYVYEALQGALAQAVLLHRAGYDVWNWSDRALLRAYEWLHHEAQFPAAGDDEWQMHVVNYFYGTNFPAALPARPGKNVGWTDWTHGPQSSR